MEGYKYEEAENARGMKPVISENMDYGLTIRAIRHLFDQSKEDKSKTVKVSCSFLQIYNEKVFDLLNKTGLKKGKNCYQNPGLKITWNKTN
jgi:hypothetical protein